MAYQRYTQRVVRVIQAVRFEANNCLQRRSREVTNAGDLPFVIRTLVDNRRGASSTGHALVAALIPIAAITAMGIVGQEIHNKPGIVANGFN
jgi:Flp pilus assembly pilin Flp